MAAPRLTGSSLLFFKTQDFSKTQESDAPSILQKGLGSIEKSAVQSLTFRQRRVE